MYVLHSRPWRETSALVEVFEREHGRVGAVARGVRRARRGAASPFQAFRLLLASWHGRGELRTLSAPEIAHSYALAGDALYAGLYLNEVLMRVLFREAGHPHLWNTYAQTLAALARGEALEPTLRFFELTLLAELGYGFALDHDVEGHAIDPGRVYHFEPEAGLVATGERADASEPLQRSGAALRIPGGVVLSLAAGDFSTPGLRAAAKAITRCALAPHLGDRPLRSRELYRRSDSSRP